MQRYDKLCVKFPPDPIKMLDKLGLCVVFFLQHRFGGAFINDGKYFR